MTVRGRRLIKAPTAGTFAAVPIDVSRAESFDVVCYVETGATATFTITDRFGVDLTAGVSLSGLTASVRVVYGSDFSGDEIRVACTAYSGTGDVAAYLESVE